MTLNYTEFHMKKKDLLREISSSIFEPKAIFNNDDFHVVYNGLVCASLYRNFHDLYN